MVQEVNCATLVLQCDLAAWDFYDTIETTNATNNPTSPVDLLGCGRSDAKAKAEAEADAEAKLEAEANKCGRRRKKLHCLRLQIYVFKKIIYSAFALNLLIIQINLIKNKYNLIDRQTD